MGFCVFTNIAVAAAMALSEPGISRIFVLDWDVHHGNGTAEIFRTRSDLLFASMHQSPLYPGSGPLSDAGGGAGEGYTINLPVPPGTGPELWMELFDRVVVPAARAFDPQLILVSSGFDAHAGDPLAHCLLETGTFVAMAARIRALAAELRVGLGLVQEGGYEPAILAECVCALLPALAGTGEAGEAVATGDPLVARAVEQYSRWWPLAR
jgi:acetoin utilization deacetylase AcuC-like enzyme